MQIIEIQGKKWSIGIEWEILPGDANPKAEAKEIAEKTDNRFGVLVEYEDTYALGLANKVDRKAPSAALTLAIANQEARDVANNYPDWIVLEEVGEDRYWMSVIKSGIPAPQFDAILSITEVKDRMTELLINDTYEVFTTSNELISIFEGFKSITSKSLNQITEFTEVTNKFEKLIGIPNSVIIAGVSLVAIIAAVWGVSLLIEGRTLKEKAEYFERQRAEETRIREENYAKALEKYERDAVKAKSEALDEVVFGLSGNASKILNAFYNTSGGIEIGTHGWDLKGVNCYYDLISPKVSVKQGGNNNMPVASNDGPFELLTKNKVNMFPRINCDSLFERTGFNTARMFLSDYPNAKLFGNHAVVFKKVDIDAKDIVKTDSTIVNALPTAKKFGFDLQSQLQLMKIVGIEHEIESSSELIYEVPGKPIKPNEGDTNIQMSPKTVESLGISMGKIIVKGTGLELLRELADNVDFSGTSIREVKLIGDKFEDLKWTATFSYYIKNQDGDVSASSNITRENFNFAPNNNGGPVPNGVPPAGMMPPQIPPQMPTGMPPQVR